MFKIVAVQTVHQEQAEAPFWLDQCDHNVPMFMLDIDGEDELAGTWYTAKGHSIIEPTKQFRETLCANAK